MSRSCSARQSANEMLGAGLGVGVETVGVGLGVGEAAGVEVVVGVCGVGVGEAVVGVRASVVRVDAVVPELFLQPTTKPTTRTPSPMQRAT